MATENENVIDYAAFLADLEAKRAKLDNAITSLRAAMAAGALGQPGEGALSFSVPSVSGSIHGGEVPAGAFLAKSIPEAAKLYLSIVKKKQTTGEIAAALATGGMETTSKNFEGTVAAGLNRIRKLTGEILKVGGAWALAEWYPAGIRAAASQTNKGRRRRGRPPKTESKVKLSATLPEDGPKPKERILQVLKNQPGNELSAQELADHLRMGKPIVHMLLGKLVQKNSIRKTESGKYRAVV